MLYGLPMSIFIIVIVKLIDFAIQAISVIIILDSTMAFLLKYHLYQLHQFVTWRLIDRWKKTFRELSGRTTTGGSVPFILPSFLISFEKS